MKLDNILHKYRLNNLNIVLDINSGAVHLFDDISYDIIEDSYTMTQDEIITKYKDKYSKKELIESYEEIKSLQKNNMLFTDDSYIHSLDIDYESSVIKALCLNVAHDCNLRCKYCFASQGNFGGKTELMSFETGKRALDFLIERSGNRKNLEVDFFGGEPLMNFDVVKKLVSYGDEIAPKHNKHFRWTITTNGILLDDEKIEYINKHMDNVVLSLDGRKSINDNNRPTINGKGSYDIIVPKYQKLIKNRDKTYYIRGTFTKENLDFTEDVLHFRDLGFNLSSIEPVVDIDENPYKITEDDLDKIEKEYEKLANTMATFDDDFKLFHFMVDLSQGPCIIKRVRGCGAGSEYLAITPSGDIFPCHQFVGKDEYKMANLYDDKINLPKDMSKKFKSSNVFTKEKCRNCWARYYCSGGCHANAINFNNNINEPYEMGCKMQRKHLECAIMLTCIKELKKEV